MSELSKSLGTMEYDGLIADINPKLVVSGGIIRKLGTAGTIKRGTILAKSGGTAGDNKLVVLGTAAASNEVLTAYCILCDDVDVGTADDVTAPVYLMGCFNSNKVTVADSYTMTEADKDALRNALKGYTRLNKKAFEKIQPGGILFTFSCSQAVNKDQFRTAVFTAAAAAKRNVRILHQLHQPADHPINIYHPEGEYLKGLVLYVE